MFTMSLADRQKLVKLPASDEEKHSKSLKIILKIKRNISQKNQIKNLMGFKLKQRLP